MEGIMGLYHGKMKVCGSCGSWGGRRELTPGNQYAKSLEQQGECLDRKGKHGIGKIGDQNSCAQWQKWAPLK
jgi:hypothetical protein